MILSKFARTALAAAAVVVLGTLAFAQETPAGGSTPVDKPFDKRTSGSVGGSSGATTPIERPFDKRTSGTVVGPYGGSSSSPLPEKTRDFRRFGVAYGVHFKGSEFMSHLHDLNVKRTKIYLYWHDLEPENDVYDFSLVDDLIAQLGSKDEVLLSIFTSSEWGAEGVGKGFPPLDYNEYYKFMYDLASHCKGRVKYWQRDVEPATPGNWDENKPHEYVMTQKKFSDAIKAADPNAVVIGGGHSGFFIKGEPMSCDFYEYFLQNSKDDFDVFDIRLYHEIEDIPERIEWFRNKMLEYGYVKPIVTTEYGGPHPCQFEGWETVRDIMYSYTGGVYDPEALLQGWAYLLSIKTTLEPGMQMFLKDAPAALEAKYLRIQARDMIQRTLLAFAGGAAHAMYWDLYETWFPDLGPHPLFGKLRLMNPETGERMQAFSVYAMMMQMVGDLTAVTRVSGTSDTIYLLKVQRAGRGDVYVAWESRDPFDGETEPAVTFTWKLPWTSVSATDFFGRMEVIKSNGDGTVSIDLTDTPVFIEEALSSNSQSTLNGR
jgi:hypothetical protein